MSNGKSGNKGLPDLNQRDCVENDRLVAAYFFLEGFSKVSSPVADGFQPPIEESKHGRFPYELQPFDDISMLVQPVYSVNGILDVRY